MDEVERLNAGKALIEKYRLMNRYGKHEFKWLIEELKKLGFSSIDDFFNAYDAFVRENIDKVFEVVGECSRCGKCCEATGCPHYKGNGVCEIYETRPKECREWPNAIHIVRGMIPKECTYSIRMKDNIPEKLKYFDFGWR